MSRFLQQMLRINRLAQACVLALGLGAGSMYLRATHPGPLVDSRVLVGVVRAANSSLYEVELEDGRRVRLWGAPGRPMDLRVRVVAERYGDGSVAFRFETDEPAG